MKFTCNRDIILREISNASDFTAQRNTLTMLSCACLILEGDNLTVKTTDQKMGYFSETTVEGFQDGVITVACDKFLEIIKNLPAEDIVFEEIEDKISIKPANRNIEFKLKTTDPSAFPTLVIPEKEDFFKISQRDFTDMINQVSFAVSDDESKFAMNGALFEKSNNSIIMVGTDGRRLSYINRLIEADMPDFPSSTIPSRFLGIIKKHSCNEGDFEVSVTPLSIFVKFGSCVIFSNLIKNEFPAYRRVIPENQTNICIVNKKSLEEALKRISILVENKFKKVILDFSENKLAIFSEETDQGAGREEIDCTYSGEPTRCAMNYLYLLNPLRVMDGNDARIEFTINSKPFTVKSEPVRDYLHVIMPMNIN